MFNNIKKNLYFKELQLLYTRGINEGKIAPFDEDLYKRLSETYISGLPVSIHIKYLKPNSFPGRCLDRSLYMFFAIDESVLVRGNRKDLELKFGKDSAFHGWIEVGNNVYDSTSLLRFDKEEYYKIYKVKNIERYTKEEYCSIKESKEFYDDIKNTTIEDFKQSGSKRYELLGIVPIVSSLAEASNDQNFINDLNGYLKKIEYNELEITQEIDKKIQNNLKQKYSNK